MKQVFKILFAIIIQQPLIINLIAQNIWEQKASFPAIGRVEAFTFSIGNKGYVGTGSNNGNFQDFYEYDQLTNTWTQKADFVGGARQGAVGFSINGKGYIATGGDSNGLLYDLWEYDPQTDSWTAKAPFPGTPRTRAVGFAIGGKGYVGTGGWTNDFWEYNPVNNTWTQKADFGGEGREGAVGFAIGNKGYIGTGVTFSNGRTRDFWEYDPITDTWEQKSDFGGVVRDFAVGFSVAGKGYLGTGGNSSNLYFDFWEYDPQNNTWIQRSDFGGSARQGAVGFSIGNKGYIGTGVSSLDFENDFWEYNPNITGITGYILGKVFADVNGDCEYGVGDYGLPNCLMKAEPGPYYGLTDNQGNYTIYTYLSDYTVTQVSQNPLWQRTCQETYQTNFLYPIDTIDSINFSSQALYYCSKLWVDVGVPFLRRCETSTYSVNYCNNGTAAAEGAVINIIFDEHITVQSSSIPWSTVINNTYTFSVGDIGIEECGDFLVHVSVDCSVHNGNSICAFATILPDTVCIPPDSAYDRRQLIILGECLQNDSVQFVIKNIHYLDITHTGEYKIYVNNQLAQIYPYNLGQGDSLVVLFPANGNTIRLEVNFIDNNGTYIGPQVTIESCGGNPGVQGQVGQLPENDDEENSEVFCQIVTGSFDPNDKSVTPSGLTSMHYIDDKDELEYLIRFQNTGTDTAFTVIIRDTISQFLDLATLVSGASSHTYTFNIYGQGIAEWTFSNILLPDSNINEPLSHGFVKYKIKQLPGNTQGTVINNSADIYFDFNEPVTTNTTENIVHDTVLLCLNAVPAFDYTQTGASFDFTNNSDYATSYSWDFDDGNTSNSVSPSHTYSESGIYTVCLDANNECGTNSLCRILNLVITGAENINMNSIRILPNPATTEITVNGYIPAYLKLCNMLGQTVAEANKSNKLYVGNLPQGLYVLQLFDEKGAVVKTERVVKE